MRKLTLAVAVLGLAPVAAVGAVIAGMRAGHPGTVALVKRLARDSGNPRVLRTAGQPGGPAAVIEHTGRTSGRSFRTPVTPMETPDGFVIALPYGSDTDWVKNVLAAGTARLVHEGRTHTVEEPEVVPLSEVATAFGARERRFLQLFGVKECLRLRRGE